MGKSKARKHRDKQHREGRPDCTNARSGQQIALSLHERRTKTAAGRQKQQHTRELQQLRRQYQGRYPAADNGLSVIMCC